MKQIFLALTLLQLTHFTSVAQKQDLHDTVYYKNFPQSLIPKFYVIKKYATFGFPSSDNTKDFNYGANTKLSAGLGLTYNNLSVTGALGFKFLNNNNQDKGVTKPFDFQFHIFPEKWSVDVFATFYKGLYAYPQGYGAVNPNDYYYRRDVKFDVIGTSAYYIPNWKKFSFRAALLQNEWQKKSAGSLLYGGQAYYNVISGDSSLIPTKLSNSFSQYGMNKFYFITIGPGVGYAYTLVAAQHFFISASVVANMDVNFATEHYLAGNKNSKISFEPAAVYKGSFGYTGNVWSVNFDWMGNAFLVKNASISQNSVLPIGEFRFFVAKKIILKKPIKIIDKIIAPD